MGTERSENKWSGSGAMSGVAKKLAERERSGSGAGAERSGERKERERSGERDTKNSMER